MSETRYAFEPETLAKFTGVNNGYKWYEIAPSILYPNSLLDLKERGHISEEEAHLAVVPRDSVYTPREIEVRAQTLERARLNFLNTLIERVGVGVGLHITRDLAWRL